MTAPIRVALTGFGGVGQALATILVDFPDIPIVLTLVADRGGVAVDPSGLDPAELLKAKAAGSVCEHTHGRPGTLDDDTLRDSNAGLLAEIASTNLDDGEPGWGYVRSALQLNMHVVLASKGPLVTHWNDIHELAAARHLSVGISATHGAPLPAIDLARVGLAGSHLRSLHALLNSTTGLILEGMETGVSYGDAIHLAQQAGVAETDPTLDVEGFDAAAKCVILSRALFGHPMKLEDVERVGITGLSGQEVREAAARGTPIKLVADIVRMGDEARATVRPCPLAPDDPLATLREGALGVVYDAEPLGRLFLAGYGKGGRATAAAVIRDVLNIAG